MSFADSSSISKNGSSGAERYRRILAAALGIWLLVLIGAVAYIRSVYSATSLEADFAPAGQNVKPKMETRAGPPVDGRGQRIVSIPDGNATHTTHLIYFGTDRTPSAPLSGVSLHTFVLIVVAFGAALLASILFWFSRRRFGLLLFVASVVLAGTAAVDFFPLKFNKFAASAFGDGRDNLACGVCAVSVPHSHRQGGLEGPSIVHFEFRENPEEHIVLQRVELMQIDKFKEDFHAAAEDAAWHEALVFVHGYNTSFEDAARRTAQLAHDLEFGGVTAFFSWPSNGHVESYSWDSQSAEYAVPHLREFIQLLAEAGKLRRIHVIAHSMGNRCATAAISRKLALNDCELDQCIFAAADVDAEIFKRDFAPKIVQNVRALTLYASSKDKALAASQIVNRFPRAGDARALVTFNGMETVDATELETDYLGHAYLGASPPLIDDLKQMIDEHMAAKERRGMKELQATGRLKYWKFVP